MQFRSKHSASHRSRTLVHRHARHLNMPSSAEPVVQRAHRGKLNIPSHMLSQSVWNMAFKSGSLSSLQSCLWVLSRQPLIWQSCKSISITAQRRCQPRSLTRLQYQNRLHRAHALKEVPLRSQPWQVLAPPIRRIENCCTRAFSAIRLPMETWKIYLYCQYVVSTKTAGAIP